MKKFRNLVIADDEPNIRNSLRLLFPWEELGVSVVFLASNGQEVLDYIDDNPVDIVLADIRMPVMDGLTLTRILKERDSSIAVVLLSAYSDFEYARSAMRYGVTAYLTKPVNYTELIDIFRKIKNPDAGDGIMDPRGSRQSETQASPADSFPAAKPKPPAGISAPSFSPTKTDNREIILNGGNSSTDLSRNSPDSSNNSEPKNSSETYRGYYNEIVTHIKEYVQSDVGNASLAGAADLTGLSPSYVSTIFHRCLGMTFSEFLAGARMDEAKRLLEKGTPVQEVAWIVGYNNPRNFVRAFKQYNGIDPNLIYLNGRAPDRN